MNLESIKNYVIPFLVENPAVVVVAAFLLLGIMTTAVRVATTLVAKTVVFIISGTSRLITGTAGAAFDGVMAALPRDLPRKHQVWWDQNNNKFRTIKSVTPRSVTYRLSDNLTDATTLVSAEESKTHKDGTKPGAHREYTITRGEWKALVKSNKLVA